jgi:hypothetical protein
MPRRERSGMCVLPSNSSSVHLVGDFTVGLSYTSLESKDGSSTCTSKDSSFVSRYYDLVLPFLPDLQS